MRPITQGTTWFLLESLESHGITVYQTDYGRGLQAWHNGTLVAESALIEEVVRRAWDFLETRARMTGGALPTLLSHQRRMREEQLAFEHMRYQEMVREARRMCIGLMRKDPE